MGMQVIGHDINIADSDPIWKADRRAPRSLDALLAESDVVTLHVPLIASTRNLMSAANIAKMRGGAVLINTSRGGIIDEAAVVEALKSGRLGGAAIDVFEREPLAATPLFADAPNLLLTPHIAGITVESNWRVSEMIAAEIIAFLSRNA